MDRQQRAFARRRKPGAASAKPANNSQGKGFEYSSRTRMLQLQIGVCDRSKRGGRDRAGVLGQHAARVTRFRRSPGFAALLEFSGGDFQIEFTSLRINSN